MNLPRVMRFLKTATARLTFSYLAIIMAMSIGFSFVLFNTSAHELNRQLPPSSVYEMQMGNPNMRPIKNQVDQFLQQRIQDGQNNLVLNLIVLNLLTLSAGSLISFALARYTLHPIEAAMAAQSRFISDASHELRTPLTAMQTASEVALRKPKLELKDAKALIASNIEEVAKLKTLSDGLLTLARQEQTVAVRQPVALQAVVSEALNKVIPLAQSKAITVDDKVPNLIVFGEEQSLVQLLVILLDNAIKYSDAHTTIHLSGQHKNGNACLSIRDEGLGIRASDLPHVFDRFYRANTARSRDAHDGYGLGLSIAKTIVDGLHGKLSVESKLGEGSTFTIKLPPAQV